MLCSFTCKTKDRNIFFYSLYIIYIINDTVKYKLKSTSLFAIILLLFLLFSFNKNGALHALKSINILVCILY